MNRPHRRQRAGFELSLKSATLYAIWTIAALALAWAAFAVTLSEVVARGNPHMALRFWPRSSFALQTAAENALIQKRYDDALQLSRRAVRQSPVASSALRTYGFVASIKGDYRAAKTAIARSAALNRRDSWAQLWLIEDAVTRADVRGALHHFDAALRVTPELDSRLFPILANALGDDDLRFPITRLLAADPAWLVPFTVFGARHSEFTVNMSRAVAMLPSSSPARIPAIEGLLLQNLVEIGHYDAARELLQSIQPKMSVAAIRNASFANSPGPYIPFDWDLTDKSEIGASIAGGELTYYAESGVGGSVARQLLMLRPGHYRLASASRKLSDDTDGQAKWVIRCAGNQSAEVAELPLPATRTTEQKINATTFEIPAKECRMQWLGLDIMATFAGKETQGSVSQVRLENL